MATVGELITDSLRQIGVLAESETPTDAAAQDARRELNRLIDQWSAEGLKMFTVTRTTWAIVSGDGQYDVGSLGDVNVARPTIVNDVKYLDTSTSPNTEYPLARLTEDAYAAIPQKSLTAVFPQAWYYNPVIGSGLIPKGNLILWPVPTSTTLTGVLYAPTALGTYVNLTNDLTIPASYARMIVKNLALELCPYYEKTPHPFLILQARDAIATVQASNKRMMDMAMDPTALIGHTGGSYNITEG